MNPSKTHWIGFLILVLAAPAHALTCTSISRNGITWTFNQAYTCGQFAAGDWWVVGPVTITNITPKDTVSTDGINMHGSMANPIPSNLGFSQAFDSRRPTTSFPAYDGSFNVAQSFPRTFSAGTSILSSESFLNDTDRPQDPLDHVPWIKRIEILTVLSAAPAPGSFRPPYVGTNKTIDPKWNTSAINYSLLHRLAPLSTTPTLAQFQALAPGPQIELYLEWKGRYIHPYTNYAYAIGTPYGCPNYGQCIAHNYGAMMLAANLNYTTAEKAPIVNRLVQMGIDFYGVTRIATPDSVGAIWPNSGGHNQGRKMPMLFAGYLIGHADMIAKANHANYKLFQEDGNYFYVTPGDVTLAHDTTCAPAKPAVPYQTANIGMAEWGQRHLDLPVQDSNDWYVCYRDIVSGATLAHILTAKVMGVRSLWNQPAAFDYFEKRAVPWILANDATNNWGPTWQHDLWASYSNVAPPSGGPQPSSSPCDLNFDNRVNADDVQLSASQVIGALPCTGDINRDGKCGVIDTQRISNAARVGGQCVTQ